MQLQELKHRASGNMDDSFANPGISERQPLHVTLVSFPLYIAHLVREGFFFVREGFISLTCVFTLLG